MKYSGITRTTAAAVMVAVSTLFVAENSVARWVRFGTGDCYANDRGTTEGIVPDDSRARPEYTAICWDGVQYNNRYNPGRAFCVYKRISPSRCIEGNTGNDGIMYASSGQQGPGGCQVAGVTCPGPGGQGLCADPNVLAVMDQWLTSATPPMRPGESLCYDCWGRTLGTTLTGTISTSQNPDTQGKTRCEWLYYLAPGLDSGNNFGTLADYLRSRGIPR